MKILVVDDEAPARQRLCRLLAELDDCHVCGEAANGREALMQYDTKAPDTVLMDIRMPEMDGLEAARHFANLEQPPAVIFTTAYGDHALEAFEAHAVDYLLKPIRKGRLADALDSARRLTGAQVGALAGRGNDVQRTHICAQVRGDLQLIPVTDIRCFRAGDKYVAVQFGDGEILIEESLKSLEEEFGERFIRIHRNALVALPYLEKLEKDEDGKSYVLLQGVPEPVRISRRHVVVVRRLLRQSSVVG